MTRNIKKEYFKLYLILITAELVRLINAAPEIHTNAGSFKGKVMTTSQGHQYFGFLGIPFALPPVGGLRFAKPLPFPKLKETYSATKLAPICIQPLGVNIGDPGKEDCLYLNVYVPATSQEMMTIGDVKKVFVYIYGGSYFMGSANEYIPGDLVTLGNVIVVTFNYRLSWLGFLKGDTPELPGNQGMWDQLMALNWVKTNIQYFGGDPNDITLGGNSMGGESISALSIIKQGQGLFTKGLIMSGSIFACPSTPGSSDVLLKALTDRVGCSYDQLGNISEIIQCLRDLPSDKFILPMENEFTSVFTAIDGELFPASIQTLIANISYLEDVGFFNRDYIVSLVNNEGAVAFHGPFKGGKDPDKIDAEFFNRRFKIPSHVASKFLHWYHQPGNFKFHPAYDIVGDLVLAMPTLKFLDVFLSKLKGDKGKSYFLFFDHEPSYMPTTLQGMVHGLDLTYLFDLTPSEVLRFYYDLHVDNGFTPDDYELKKIFIHILADLMKTSNPGISLSDTHQIFWSVYEKDAEHYLSLSLRPAIKNFPLHHHRHMWNKVLPVLLEAEADKKDEL